MADGGGGGARATGLSHRPAAMLFDTENAAPLIVYRVKPSVGLYVRFLPNTCTSFTCLILLCIHLHHLITF